MVKNTPSTLRSLEAGPSGREHSLLNDVYFTVVPCELKAEFLHGGFYKGEGELLGTEQIFLVTKKPNTEETVCDSDREKAVFD